MQPTWALTYDSRMLNLSLGEWELMVSGVPQAIVQEITLRSMRQGGTF